MNALLRIARAALPVATSLVALTPVYAQTTTAQPAAEGLGDIVVTAEKRPSVLQRTPIAISVIDPEAIKRNNVGSVEDLARIAPSFSFQAQHTQAILSIRGVSSRDTSEIGDPAVALSIDGTYSQRAVGLNAAIFDIDRIEVLRGPQGTLLGRNATGGAVNIVTGKPMLDHFAASVSAEAGNYDAFITKGMVNLPVTDTLAIRAAFQTRDHSGYRENYPARDGDDEHSKAARLTALFKPTDRFSVTLSGEYTFQNGVGPVPQAIAWRNGANGTTDFENKPAIPGDGKTFSLTQGGFLHLETTAIRWNVDYDLGIANITYLGGFRSVDFKRLANYGTVYGGPRQNLSFNQVEKPETWNHELRLTSKAGGPLKWQIGGFYFREKNDLTTLIEDYPGKAALLAPASVLQRYRYPDVVSESKALFGQVGYKLTDTVEVEAGTRYSDNDKHRTGFNQITNTNAFYSTGAINYTTTQQASDAASKIWTYHAGLNWQATPRHLLYAKFDTGFKDGGFTDLASYDPEKITAYEIGSKNRFFGNTLQVNLAAFWYDYSDQQVTQSVNINGTARNLVVNAGKSRYKGAEVELNWLATPADRFDAFVGYTHAEYTNFAVLFNGVNTQLAGNTPPQAPRWSVNLGYSHDFELASGTLTPRLQTHIESETYFTFFNRGTDRQGGYHRSDFTLTYKPRSGAWQVDAFVRNIEDKLILSYAFDPTGATRSAYVYQYAPPRTFGGRVTVNF
ncbi:TonB-dependent receptor [Sphingomonas naphthae]|uniref:TonB-dependent receptor n=1 Tax=Sphingomonas naphthae TaxID=1813468 RepID=A0ABY7TIR4_9SPHN|nr:TonB-dependent receptor [Sphingomonas naphthae]WCT73085.1 TonB-dependent receptor [Sphingomonas naphthae]